MTALLKTCPILAAMMRETLDEYKIPDNDDEDAEETEKPLDSMEGVEAKEGNPEQLKDLSQLLSETGLQSMQGPDTSTGG